MSFANRDLYTHSRSQKLRFASGEARMSQFKFVTEKYPETEITEDIENRIRSKITVFCSHLNTRWQKASRAEKPFLMKNEQWLNNKSEYFPSNTRESEFTQFNKNSINKSLCWSSLKFCYLFTLL